MRRSSSCVPYAGNYTIFSAPPSRGAVGVLKKLEGRVRFLTGRCRFWYNACHESGCEDSSPGRCAQKRISCRWPRRSPRRRSISRMSCFSPPKSPRTSLWRRLGRRGECARKSAVALFALVSALGVWYEIPEVTRYDIAVDGAKIPPGGLRFAVVSDLHSCRYGLGTVRAHTGHSSPKARCRLSSWATFSTT